MDDVYNNIHDYNPNKKRKILILFDEMLAYIITNHILQAIIKELFFRCRKLNISLTFIIILFFCSKRLKIKIYTLRNNEDS